MKDPYLELSPDERRELLNELSLQTGLAPSILEKDFWVCHCLEALFSLPVASGNLVFKGGTSLSKVYGLIERFSEDIDLSFQRSFLGFADEAQDPERGGSKKEQRRRLERLTETCIHYVREEMLPALDTSLKQRIPDHDWSMEIDSEDLQTILFHYPSAGVDGLSYIRPSVRIELGARSDHWPAEQRQIRSYLGDQLDKPLGVANVTVLKAERTFWEKATLLHAEFHRSQEKTLPARYARHYHDLAQMAETDVVARALKDRELRERVVVHKSIYFRSSWANYEQAVPGSFHLIPDEYRMKELERDYQAMLPMFFREPLSFQKVIETLTDLEHRINSP